MPKDYNIWVSLEIYDWDDENGKDVELKKLKKFDNLEDAMDFFENLC